MIYSDFKKKGVNLNVIKLNSKAVMEVYLSFKGIKTHSG